MTSTCCCECVDLTFPKLLGRKGGPLLRQHLIHNHPISMLEVQAGCHQLDLAQQVIVARAPQGNQKDR